MNDRYRNITEIKLEGARVNLPIAEPLYLVIAGLPKAEHEQFCRDLQDFFSIEIKVNEKPTEEL